MIIHIMCSIYAKFSSKYRKSLGIVCVPWSNILRTTLKNINKHSNFLCLLDNYNISTHFSSLEFEKEKIEYLMSQKWKEFTTIPKILACQMDHIILSNPIWKGIGSFFDQNPSNHKYAVKERVSKILYKHYMVK